MNIRRSIAKAIYPEAFSDAHLNGAERVLKITEMEAERLPWKVTQDQIGILFIRFLKSKSLAECGEIGEQFIREFQPKDL